MLCRDVLLLVAALGLAAGRQVSVPLRLEDAESEHFSVESTQFDNVWYRHFRPVKSNFLRRIESEGSVVWESASVGRCVYALLSLKSSEPHLLYIQVDHGYTVNHLYFKRGESGWSSIDLEDYCHLLYDVKRSVKINGEFGYLLSNAADDTFLTVKYSSSGNPYTLFTSNVGYFGTSVFYESEKLWEAKKYGERCVAAWCYVHSGAYYMIRFLVTNPSEESQVHTYFFIDSKWVHVHTLQENHDKADEINRPQNFYYPNYTFTLKPIIPSPSNKVDLVDTVNPVDKVQPSEVLGESELDELGNVVGSSIEQVKEPYYDESGDYSRFLVHDEDLEDLSGEPVSKTHGTLDLSPSVSYLFSRQRWVENVLYRTYKPHRSERVSSVVESSSVVWSAKSDQESCFYAMTAQKDESNYVLYLLIKVGGELRQAFFEKLDGDWRPSNKAEYVKHVKFLKGFTTHYDIEIDVTKFNENDQYSVEFSFEPKGYHIFLPNMGYACRKVLHNDTLIWKSDNPFDKCVAVWVYRTMARVYFMRLLLSYQDGTSDVLSFLNVGTDWEMLASFKYSAFNKTLFKKLDDFYNPEYEINSDVPDYSQLVEDTESKAKNTEDNYEMYMEGKTLVTLSQENEFTEFMEGKYYLAPSHTTQPSSQDTGSNSSLSSLYNYKPVFEPVTPKQCLRLELSDFAKGRNFELDEAVFDKTLNLQSYRASPGFYFGTVYENDKPIFIGHYSTHLCKAFNVYTKAKQPYLADMLIKFKNEDVTLHLVKNGRKWDYVSKTTFLKLLHNLSSQK